jgi:TPR repeat protein
MSSRWAEAYLAEKTKEGGDATRGLPDSCFAVGNIYRRGYGVVPDSASAFAWFEKAADKKSWKAMLRLADLLKNGEGCKKNVEAAREWEVKAIAELQPLADNGQAEAQRGLADCYVNAWGVEKSYEMAVRLYADAYECRDWLALGRLSRLYAEGLGVAKDVDKARTMLQLAAEKESSEACGRLGECYEYGELSIAKDHKKAVEWYRKSAAQGYAVAQFILGYCYAEGTGVTQDYAEAVKWFRKSAEQGNADAQFNLGYCYEEGNGVTQDYAEAVKWYRKSAEQGDADAQFSLGCCYEEGNGVLKDIPEAIKWYTKAAEQGDEEAGERIKVLKQEGEQ